MTDYAGEQAMEIEALQAILMDDLQVYEGTHPDGWNVVGESYIVSINSLEEGDEEDENLKEMELVFGHTEKYPDEGPCYRLRVVSGLSDGDIAEGMGILAKEVEANLGMSMVFALHTAAKEWLQSKAQSSGEDDPDVARRKEAEAEEQRRIAARLHGTPVTQEGFAEWKKKYDEERKAQMMQNIDKSAEEARASRMSGKAWFHREGANAEDDAATEAGALSEDDEEDFNDEDDEDFDEEDDIDYDDDDDEGMLEVLVPDK